MACFLLATAAAHGGTCQQIGATDMCAIAPLKSRYNAPDDGKYFEIKLSSQTLLNSEQTFPRVLPT